MEKYGVYKIFLLHSLLIHRYWSMKFYYPLFPLTIVAIVSSLAT